MKIKPLDKIGFNLKDHLMVLYIIGLVYRNPRKAIEEIEDKMPIDTNVNKLKLVVKININFYKHLLIYMVIICLVGNIFLYKIGVYKDFTISFVMVGIVAGIVMGIVTGITGRNRKRIVEEIIVGIIEGIIAGIALGITGRIVMEEIVMGIFLGIFIGSVIGIVAGIDGRIAGANKRVIIGVSVMGSVIGIVYKIVGGIVFVSFFLIFYFKLWYYSIVFLQFIGIFEGKTYKLHPLCWDRACIIPFPFFDRTLVSLYHYDKQFAEKEIDEIVKYSPWQKLGALRAQAIIIAEKAQKECDLVKLKDIVRKLPGGSEDFLSETKYVKEMAYSISDKQLRVNNSIETKLKEDRILDLLKAVEQFNYTVRGFKYPLADEFMKAGEKWLKIVEKQLEIYRKFMEVSKALQVFKAGESIKRNNNAFIRRDNVLKEIQKSITSEAGCTGILLYGRRRIGKTTILYNLDESLDGSAYHIVYLSMQGPEYNASLENDFIPRLLEKLKDFSDCMNNGMAHSVQGFYKQLTKCDENLNKNKKYVIICIDEYEYMHKNIIEGVFNVELLSIIRQSIQNHDNIFWILAGSHKIAEFEGVQWTSYLISMKTVEVPRFTIEETKQLLTEPFKFADSENLKSTRINIWKENIIELIYSETAGWAYFVQAVAEKAVDFLNESKDDYSLTEELMQKVFNKVVETSESVFHQILRNESVIEGEWEYILGFTSSNLLGKPDNPMIRESLKRRLIVKEVDGMWQLKVPLMARWLKSNY